MKKCPYCAEEIQNEAILCRFCGQDLSAAVPKIPQVYEKSKNGNNIYNATSKKEKKNLTEITIAVIIAIPILCCCVGILFLYTYGDYLLPLNYANPIIPTQNKYPTATNVTDMLYKTPNSYRMNKGKIPGITPDKLITAMEGSGFDCSLEYAAIPSDPYYKWECRIESSSELAVVEFWSTSLTTIDSIRATIIQFGIPNDSLSISILGPIATIPYIGASPDQAKDWVTSTLPTITKAGDVRTNIFGGVNYQLYGIQSARSLIIGDDLPFP